MGRYDDETSRVGYEWGLASLLTGGMLMLMAPVMLIVNLMIWAAGRNFLARSDLEMAYVGALAGVAGVGLLCLAGVLIGVRGLFGALAHATPVALPLAGILAGLVALVLWGVVGYDLIAILQSYLRWNR